MSVPIFGSEIVAAQLSVLKNLAKRGRKRTHDRGREGGGAGKMFWHPTCISCVWGPRAGNIFLDNCQSQPNSGNYTTEPVSDLTVKSAGITANEMRTARNER